jgi:hypothetical protein
MDGPWFLALTWLFFGVVALWSVHDHRQKPDPSFRTTFLAFFLPPVHVAALILVFASWLLPSDWARRVGLVVVVPSVFGGFILGMVCEICGLLKRYPRWAPRWMRPGYARRIPNVNAAAKLNRRVLLEDKRRKKAKRKQSRRRPK